MVIDTKKIQYLKEECFDWDEFYKLNANTVSLYDLKVELRNGWSYLLLEPKLFLDDEEGCIGFDIIQNFEKEVSDEVIFALTEFECMEEVPVTWLESYSSKKIANSSFPSWQFSGSGLFFTPLNKNWFALYIDNPFDDFVLFIGPDLLIESLCSNSVIKSSLKNDDIGN